MKEDKKNIKSALLEGLFELILSLICLGVGALIIGLFGVDFDSADIDYDLIILLGLVALVAVFGIFFALVRWIKKTLKKNKK